MAKRSVQRKLTAILAADVVGYSRLVREDEDGTIAAVKAAVNDAFTPQIKKHKGRIFKTMGDAVLAEFSSAVDALKCAVAIQKKLAGNALVFRMAINLGDVIIEGDDVHGDGVNIAARLEALAEPGGICISGKVLEEVRGKVELGFRDLGPQKAKNIADPVPAYAVLLDPADAGKLVAAGLGARLSNRKALAAAAVVVVAVLASLAVWRPWTPDGPAGADLAQQSKPSIAVLPFTNLADDKSQDFLGDGIADNITTALARLPTMFVIARSSTLAYKGKTINVQQVARELGVRYVLEGTVQRAGDKVRIAAKLIDARKGNNVWARTYDRDVKNALALQDDITLSVIVALEVNLTEGGGARIQRGNTTNIEAYQLGRRATLIFRRLTPDGNAETRRLSEQALKLDPDYTLALFFIGNTHLISAIRRWTPDPKQELKRAEEYAQRILKIDPNAAIGYLLLSSIANAKKQHDKAIEYGRKAHALEPNGAMIAGLLGYRLTAAGKPKEALVVIEKAKRLTPNGLHPVLRFEGAAYYVLGQIDKAIASFERARTLGPKALNTHAFLALTYATAGRLEEARAAAAHVLKLAPRFSARRWLISTGIFKSAKLEPQHDILVKLGLPK
jgi:TolB-like protein/class 3 adenylate cyclase